ncbi:ATPase, AAA-type, core [uncultured Caudovirales phage]|uniref:ATPase, AAA-type, core n=1 Tax=uncultured Caudovirales phage TaxID=2100421 RepID=A0A6J5LUH8_9CAUD|nr:ATPase, AAA-type, core [uncultured Caudovirales phage]
MRKFIVLRKSNKRPAKKFLKIKHLRGYKLRQKQCIQLVDRKRHSIYNSCILTKVGAKQMTTVTIKSGSYRNKPVANVSFALVKGFQTGAKGNFVTVKSDGYFGPEFDEVRIKVDSIEDIEFAAGTPVLASEPVAEETVAVVHETDEQAIERIRTRFQILDEMTKAATTGDIRAMIVSGPPGVGKSYGVEKIVEQACLFDKLSGKRLRAEVVKGSATPIGLYQTLYKYSDKNCMLVFDDCDSILVDDVALNLLKGALDSGSKRKISWLSESSSLRREGIPDSFNFNGSIIFITNLKFDKMKSQKLKDHLDALQSRCHYLDLTLDTMRDKILRIKQIAADGALFENMDLDKEAETEVIEFMEEHKNSLREVSLRMAIKIGQLRKSFALRWKDMARITCMKSA